MPSARGAPIDNFNLRYDAGKQESGLIHLLESLFGILPQAHYDRPSPIGAGAINPNQDNPFAGIGTGAIIWWIVSLLISMFVGGWVSGKLAGIPRTADSVLHGLLSYAVFTLFSVFILTSAVGSVISRVGSVISTTLTFAAKGVEKAVPAAADVVQGQLAQNGVDLGTLKQEARDLLRDTGKPELQPENMGQQGSAAGNSVQWMVSEP